MFKQLFKNPYPDIENLPEIVEANPNHIWLEPTNRCNNRCRHCGHFYSDFGKDMPDSVIDEVKKALLPHVKSVRLVGYGEPLIAKGIIRILDECLHRNIHVNLTTNGILCRDPRIVKMLVDCEVCLNFSIDGASPRTFNFVRPYIKWEDVIKALELIKQTKDSAGCDNRFDLQFNFVPMKVNIYDLPKLIQLASQYGASTVKLLPLSYEDNFPDVKGLSLDQSSKKLHSILKKSYFLAHKLKISLALPGCFRSIFFSNCTNKFTKLLKRLLLAVRTFKLNRVMNYISRLLYGSGPKSKAGTAYCLYPWEGTSLTADGIVYPCCVCVQPLGDIRKQKWSEIWNGYLYKNLRRTIHGWNPTANCRYCGLPAGINGGDSKAQEHYFNQFSVKKIGLDSKDCSRVCGFYELEYSKDGRTPYCWMNQTGILNLKKPPQAKFLKINISPKAPADKIIPGMCKINSQWIESFDNSCSSIYFPVDQCKNKDIRVKLEMAWADQTNDDTRSCALMINGLAWLC